MICDFELNSFLLCLFASFRHIKAKGVSLSYWMSLLSWWSVSKVCSMVWLFLVVFLGVFSPIQGGVVADSVSDFSGEQGKYGWFYGYVDSANSGQFVKFPVFGEYSTLQGDSWYIDLPTPGTNPPHVFTVLFATGGAPNAIISSGGVSKEQWAARRWISNVSGEIEISGIYGDPDAAGDLGKGGLDGVICQIVVDGEEVWVGETNGFNLNLQYRVKAEVAIGSSVDFIIRPKSNDYSDAATFTARIDSMQSEGRAGQIGVKLEIVKEDDRVMLSWSAHATGWTLEYSKSSFDQWQPFHAYPVFRNGKFRVSDMIGYERSCFYRIKL